MKIAISVESTHDLTKELLDKYDIKVIPFNIVLGDKEYADGQLSTQEIFDFVNKNGILPKTTALNSYTYQEYFESLKKDYDAVIHIALSSGITSSTGNAINAAKEVENCFIVDSLSLSTGIGLLAIYARELADKGFAPSEIAEKVSKRTSSVQASFVIERLDFLHKGGRCSSIALLGANILKIRPRIVLKNGKMISDKKYRGNMPSVIAKYCQETLSEFNNPDLDKVCITYSTATEDMISEAKNALINAGFKNIYETHAGCTIASHCGANTLGILYFNDGGKDIY
ncbi:MAG: DegV family protein [Clostridia bacterium]|nr:DegV family protein [Clostridia bacterium]